MVLEDSDSESENDEGLVVGAGPNAVRNMGMLTPVLDAGAASDIDLSPAPASATASEASFMSASTPLLCYDGVIRDAQRVPLVTPGTVTMFRGAAAPMREDGIAADLYRSFTTPETPYEADEEAEEEKDADEEYSPVLAGRALELPAEAEEEELLGANNNNDEVHGNNLLPQAQQQEQEEESGTPRRNRRRRKQQHRLVKKVLGLISVSDLLLLLLLKLLLLQLYLGEAA